MSSREDGLPPESRWLRYKGRDPRLAIRYWPDPKDGPWQIATYFAPIEGRLEVIGMQIVHLAEAEPLRASKLREVPWDTEWREARAALVRDTKWVTDMLLSKTKIKIPDEILARTKPVPPDLDKIKLLLAAEEERALLKAKRPRSYGPDHYEQVAELYDQAYRAGLHPTKYVEEQLNARSRNTAAKWVATARKMGLLPPTEKRKPKGNPLTKEESE
jgi:hypothetical protein